MRHSFHGGCDRRFAHSDDRADRRHGERHGGHHHGHRMGGGRRGGRLFDYGELRLLTLSMISEQPSHGYELIKGIEDRMGGGYAPSPGVIYPTLAWLEDMGYATVDAEAGGRKRYRITEEGSAFLTANRAAVEALVARVGQGGGRGEGVPAPILRAMENLKLALRLRLRNGPLEQATAETIAAALDAAAQAIEKT